MRTLLCIHNSAKLWHRLQSISGKQSTWLWWKDKIRSELDGFIPSVIGLDANELMRLWSWEGNKLNRLWDKSKNLWLSCIRHSKLMSTPIVCCVSCGKVRTLSRIGCHALHVKLSTGSNWAKFVGKLWNSLWARFCHRYGRSARWQHLLNSEKKKWQMRNMAIKHAGAT